MPLCLCAFCVSFFCVVLHAPLFPRLGFYHCLYSPTALFVCARTDQPRNTLTRIRTVSEERKGLFGVSKGTNRPRPALPKGGKAPIELEAEEFLRGGRSGVCLPFASLVGFPSPVGQSFPRSTSFVCSLVVITYFLTSEKATRQPRGELLKKGVSKRCNEHPIAFALL